MAIGDAVLAARSVVVLEEVPDELGGLAERIVNKFNGRPRSRGGIEPAASA